MESNLPRDELSEQEPFVETTEPAKVELTEEQKQQNRWDAGRRAERRNLVRDRNTHRQRRKFWTQCGVVQMPQPSGPHAYPIHPSTKLRVRGARLRATSSLR